MSKNVKIIITIVLVIVVVIICCCVFGKNKEKKQDTDFSENIITNEIIKEENKIKEDNTVKNEVNEEIIQNVVNVEKQGTVYETNTNAGTTDKKQDAIDLVKEKWGEDYTVTFRCDSITNKGEYIIAVVSKETATVKNYFKVNLATKNVEVDY